MKYETTVKSSETMVKQVSHRYTLTLTDMDTGDMIDLYYSLLQTGRQEALCKHMAELLGRR